jgi:hypothetical protein
LPDNNNLPVGNHSKDDKSSMIWQWHGINFHYRFLMPIAMIYLISKIGQLIPSAMYAMGGKPLLAITGWPEKFRLNCTKTY